MLPLILMLALAEPGVASARTVRDPKAAAARRETVGDMARSSEPEGEAARALGRLAAGEPCIEDVQAAAARRAGFDAESAESWRSRSRSAAWLPKLTAEYRHDQRSYHVTGYTASGEVDTLRASPGDLVGVRATWDLDALIFSSSETQAAATAANLLKRRDELVEHVTRLFFKRQKLRLALMVAAPAAPQLRVEAELELAEVTSQLDALTGGLFAERMP
jgi:hypothetical protein